ncbi:MAG: mannose-1-phosphate guanylyltransferase/mannose-6-phosphate isomerase [Desulfobacterales bacterium]|nr:mannose-1-phosphate guanylyltransferase/mannose-6-phosphate isomerase [Desulfobacterales bacterium]
MAEKETIIAVLLAGGSGTRLWPVSRTLFPKQLVHFLGKDSLVQRTVKRLLPMVAPGQIFVVCGQDHAHEIARHMAEVGVDAEGRILAEPCGRNTAPAILLAVNHVLQRFEDPVVLVFPADHVIADIERFHEKLGAAAALAKEGRIVTFGIQPHYPETGYGYIEGGGALAHGALAIRRFVEKPDLATARSYLAAGNFFWNSGMFAFRATVMAEEFARHCPELAEQMASITAGGGPVEQSEYEKLPNISIDYAIMENTALGAVLPSDFGWSDIGSWKSLYDFLPKDEAGNVVDGNVVTRRTKDSFIMGYERLIAVNKMDHVVVVETPDSVFVSDLEESRDVKEIVDQLKRQGRREVQQHRTLHADWGRRTVLDEKPDYTVERLVLFPGQSLTLATGRGRIQHLIVVRGTGAIAVDADRRSLGAGDNAVIPENDSADMTNDTESPLVILRIETPY